MKKPEKVPEAVQEAIKKWAKQHPTEAEVFGGGKKLVAVEPLLQWDSILGCYYFYSANMFHGVELNGHIHT